MGKYANAQRKRRNNKWLIVILAVLLVALVAVVAVGGWIALRYHIVGGELYLKGSQELDLRGESIQPSHFDKLSQKMPDCDIRWDIPFQGGILKDDAREVTVSSLSSGDIEMLDYAKKLTTVNAEGCTDYENLAVLRQLRPELEVIYSVAFSSGNYAWDVDTLMLTTVAEEDIHLLKHLPNLKTVVLAGGSYDAPVVEALRVTEHGLIT